MGHRLGASASPAACISKESLNRDIKHLEQLVMSDISRKLTSACVSMLREYIVLHSRLWLALCICFLRVARRLWCWRCVRSQKLAHLLELQLDQGLPSLLCLVLLIDQMKDEEL